MGKQKRGEKMNSYYGLRKLVVGYIIAGSLLLSGCSRIERIVEERDREINKRLAATRFFKKQMGRAEKGIRILEQMIYGPEQ
jgi:hypothetical protein